MARFRDHRVFSECMWHRRALRLQCLAKNAPVAQLDRALDYESRGQEFESLRARQHCWDGAKIICGGFASPC